MFHVLNLGETLKSVGIERTVVADGCIGRAILLDNRVRAKLIAWDKETSLKVAVDTLEQAVQLGLSPRNIYYLLVARLSTDQRGNISSEDVVVEYCELSEKSYKEFSDITTSMGTSGNSVTLQKSDRGQFSYLQIKPANIQFPEGLLANVQRVKESAPMYWEWIDKNGARTVQDYLIAKQGSPVGYGQYSAQPLNYGQLQQQQFVQPIPVSPVAFPKQSFSAPQALGTPQQFTATQGVPVQSIPVENVQAQSFTQAPVFSTGANAQPVQAQPVQAQPVQAQPVQAQVENTSTESAPVVDPSANQYGLPF